MKVNGIQMQNIYESYQSNLHKNETTAAQGDESGNRDTLKISPRASGLKEAGALAGKMPRESDASRSVRIQDVKNRIDAGTYDVSSKTVAKAVLKGMYLDEKA